MEDGDSTCLQNVSLFLPDYTASNRKSKIRIFIIGVTKNNYLQNNYNEVQIMYNNPGVTFVFTTLYSLVGWQSLTRLHGVINQKSAI
jgi:hypothetical protein